MYCIWSRRTIKRWEENNNISSREDHNVDHFCVCFNELCVIWMYRVMIIFNSQITRYAMELLRDDKCDPKLALYGDRLIIDISPLFQSQSTTDDPFSDHILEWNLEDIYAVDRTLFSPVCPLASAMKGGGIDHLMQ